MMKIAPISFAFALALSGCADHTVAGGNEGEGEGEQFPEPDPQIDAQGTYRLHSVFDLATNMPGTSGNILNGLIDATDDADDPMSWVVDLMLAQMDDGTLKDILVGAKPFVIGYLNDRVTSLAPDLVGTINEIGDRMAEVTQKFGINEKLEVVSVDQTYIARSTADAARLTLAGTTKDYLFVDHNIDNVIVNDILITVDKGQGRFHIGEHNLPLPYGKLVRLALDAAVIPAIDPTATTLGGLLSNVVNCTGVGTSINNALGFGSAAFWATACTAGLNMAANMIYDQIADSDSILDMHLVGQARYSDVNMDYKVDELKFGNWTGSMKYSGVDAALAQPASFDGKRM